jgi:hypothetical protein
VGSPGGAAIALLGDVGGNLYDTVYHVAIVIVLLDGLVFASTPAADGCWRRVCFVSLPDETRDRFISRQIDDVAALFKDSAVQ